MRMKYTFNFIKHALKLFFVYAYSVSNIHHMRIMYTLYMYTYSFRVPPFPCRTGLSDVVGAELKS